MRNTILNTVFIVLTLVVIAARAVVAFWWYQLTHL